MGVSGGRLGETGQSIIELGFAVPLPIIDRSKGRKQEAQANMHVAEAEQAAVEQRLLHAWGTASRRFQAGLEQVTSYRERILPKANEALRLVQAGFEQGKFGFIDLLDIQRTTAEARLAYQGKLLELNIAQAELEALLPPQASQRQPPSRNRRRHSTPSDIRCPGRGRRCDAVSWLQETGSRWRE
jgi:cobalt-zinc-cadmium efflux system outer membrane protein